MANEGLTGQRWFESEHDDAANRPSGTDAPAKPNRGTKGGK
jgi:hypothetical protein